MKSFTVKGFIRCDLKSATSKGFTGKELLRVANRVHQILGGPGKSRVKLVFTNEKREKGVAFPNEKEIKNVNYFFF